MKRTSRHILHTVLLKVKKRRSFSNLMCLRQRPLLDYCLFADTHQSEILTVCRWQLLSLHSDDSSFFLLSGLLIWTRRRTRWEIEEIQLAGIPISLLAVIQFKSDGTLGNEAEFVQRGSVTVVTGRHFFNIGVRRERGERRWNYRYDERFFVAFFGGSFFICFSLV